MNNSFPCMKKKLLSLYEQVWITQFIVWITHMRNLLFLYEELLPLYE